MLARLLAPGSSHLGPSLACACSLVEKDEYIKKIKSHFGMKDEV